MKASQFKELIKEAVREVLTEDLREIIEASTNPGPPNPPQNNVKSGQGIPPKTGNPILDALNETRNNMTSEDFRNINGDGGNMRAQMAQNLNRATFMPQGRAVKPVSDSPEAVAQAVASAPKTGLDLSQLGFVNKAAAIVNTSIKKDKERFGV